MSVHTSSKKLTALSLAGRRGSTPPIVGLTAYTAPMAQAMDPHVDFILVGDSLAMTIYGESSTVGVDLDTMIRHGRAVVRACDHACVVVDLPFGSYQASPEQAFHSASRILMETGCDAVKLEGGAEMAETVQFLSQRGIPVLGHIGLMPQSVNQYGFRAQGKTDAEAKRIMKDAKAIADAGAFAVVIEGTVESVARKVTKAIPIPTIGIGASPACDGQILVTEDLVGLFKEFTPKFVKRYSELGQGIAEAAKEYAKDVRTGRFPGPEHCFGMKPPPKSKRKK